MMMTANRNHGGRKRAMTLTQLSYVQAIIQYGSMREAARRLYVSEATISKQIRALEQEWGIVLFRRHGHRVSPTLEAEQLTPLIANLLRSEQDLAQALGTLREPAHGTLKFGIVPSAALWVLPRLIREFGRRWPHVTVECHEGGSHELLSAVASSALDVALLAHSPVVPMARGPVTLEPLLAHHLLVVVAYRHPLARAAHVTVDVLRQQRIVLFRSGYVVRDLVLAVLGPDAERHIVYATDNSATARTMVEHGFGVMFLPEFLVSQREPAFLTRTLRAIPVKDNPFRIDLCLAYLPRQFRPPFFEEFLARVRATITQGMSPSRSTGPSRRP